MANMNKDFVSSRVKAVSPWPINTGAVGRQKTISIVLFGKKVKTFTLNRGGLLFYKFVRRKIGQFAIVFRMEVFYERMDKRV